MDTYKHILKVADKKKKVKRVALTAASISLVAGVVAVPTVVTYHRKNEEYEIVVDADATNFQEYSVTLKRGSTIKNLKEKLNVFEGHELIGIYKDQACTMPYSDADKVTKSTTVFLKYERESYTVSLPQSTAYSFNYSSTVDPEKVLWGDSFGFSITLNPPYTESNLTVKADGVVFEPNASGWYEITFVNKDITIEIEGVEYNVYSVGEIPSQVTVLNAKGEAIAEGDTITHDDILTITYQESENKTKTEFSVTGATSLGENKFQVTGNLQITYAEEYLSYLITVPTGITVLKNGEVLEANSQNKAIVQHNDILTISAETVTGYNCSFTISGTGLTHVDGNNYRVTGKDFAIEYNKNALPFAIAEEYSNFIIKREDGTKLNSESIIYYDDILTIEYARVGFTLKDNYFKVNGAELVDGKYRVTGNLSITDYEEVADTFNLTVSTTAEQGKVIVNLVTIENGVETRKEVTPGEGAIKYGDKLEISYQLTNENYRLKNFIIDDVPYTYTEKVTLEVTKDVKVVFEEVLITYSLDLSNIPLQVGIVLKDGTNSDQVLKTAGLVAENNKVSVPQGVTLIVSYSESQGATKTEFTVDGVAVENNAEVLITSGFDGIIVTYAEETIQYTLNISERIAENVVVNLITTNAQGAEVKTELQTGATIPYGSTLEISYTEATGYDRSKFKINGKEVTGTQAVTIIANEESVIENKITVEYAEVLESYTIDEEFSDKITITNQNGAVVNEGDTIYYGDVLTFSYNSVDNHDIVITINGEKLIGNTYTVVGEIKEITYAEERITHTLDLSSIPLQVAVLLQDGNTKTTLKSPGSAASETSVTVPQGAKLIVSYTETTGYDKATFIVNGSPAENNAEVAISADFAGLIVEYTETIETYTLTINYNDQNGTTEVVELPKGTNVMEYMNNYEIEAEGYTCIGWSTTADGEVITDLPTSMSSDLTYYAVWGTITYKITSNSEYIKVYALDGTELTTNEVSAGTEVTVVYARDYYDYITITVDGKEIESGDETTVMDDISIEVSDEYTGYNAQLINSDTAYEIIKWDPTAETATIPSSIKGLPVTSIGDDAFYSCSNLTNIIIPDSVEIIGTSAFSFTSLTQIEIPNSVITMGDSAFYGCSSLESVTLSKNLTVIHDNTFDGCSSLQSLEIPASVTFIGEHVLRRSCALEELTIQSAYAYNRISDPDTDGTSLLYGASCRKIRVLKNIVDYNTNAYLNSDLFYESYDEDENYYFYALKDTATTYSLTINYNDQNGTTEVVELPEETNIKTYLENYVITAEGYNFLGWSETEDGEVTTNFKTSMSSDLTYYAVWEETYSVTANSEYIEFYEGSTKITDLSAVKNGTELIVKYSRLYYWYSSLKANGIEINSGDTITITEDTNIEVVEKYLGFTYNTINNGTEYQVVSGDPNATELVIPSTLRGLPLTTIAGWAFEDCNNLTKVVISDGVTHISDVAFYHCLNLTSVTIPDSVEIIGDSAFSWTSLTQIEIPDTVTEMGERVFYNCDYLESVKLPKDLKYIPNGMFGSCDNLTNITIQESIESIGERAFESCDNLTNITIPKNVRTIGKYAFYQCSNLENIIIENGVETIEDFAFYVCYGAKSINIPSSVTTLGKCVLATRPYTRDLEVTIDSVDAYTTALGYDYGVGGILEHAKFAKVRVLKSIVDDANNVNNYLNSDFFTKSYDEASGYYIFTKNETYTLYIYYWNGTYNDARYYELLPGSNVAEFLNNYTVEEIEGYTFEGWSTTYRGEVVTDLPTSMDSDLEFYTVQEAV